MTETMMESIGLVRPKISIISVVLNNRPHIEDCIRSVLNQTYDNIEYIVVDGGSTDGTKEILKKYEDKFFRWVSEPDKGIYDAMNKGINLATGDIVGFLNSDDVYYDSSVLEHVSQIMADSSTDLCYFDLVYVKENDTGNVVRYWKSCNYKKGLFARGWVPPHPTVFVRKSVYAKHGAFNLDYPLAADFELMARLLDRFQVRSVYIPRISTRMRLGGATNKSMSNIIKQNCEIYLACRRNKITLPLLPFLLFKVLSRTKQFFIRPVQ